jgi:hypothetical protein
MKKFLVFIILTTGVYFQAAAQSSKLFNDSCLASVYITIPPDSLAILYDSVLSDHYYMAGFLFNDGEKTDVLDSIGFRLRGNTSRFSKKKSFKISFNEYVPGRRYQGVKKINLNGEHNDPTLIREKLFYDLWKKAGMVERRTSFARVYINGQYYGLYTCLEEMDKDWLDRVYSDKSGNLYKCTYPADLVYHGPDQQTYKDLENSTVTGGRVYDLQTNETQDDYTRLVTLIAQLDKSPDVLFEIETGQILHVSHFLKALALDVATGNWDDYSYNKNNYYLYDNPATGRFDFITYDPDNSFGVDWFGIDWASQDFRKWVNPAFPLPLAQKLLKVPSFSEQYRSFLDTIAHTIIPPDSVFPRIDHLKQLIQQAAEEDLFRTLDYGYSISDFNNSYTMKTDSHTPIGLKPFFTRRHETLLKQLKSYSIEDYSGQSETMTIYPDPVADDLNLRINRKNCVPLVVSITDLSGKTVYMHTLLDDGGVSIKAGFLSPGYYLLQVELPSGEKFRRPFIKTGDH